ncbi:MAG: chitobiase/beta-hexosaminidase C-terminal domain-containing protein [Planctomycetota bacterium]|nr:chitobiase/beta-hexosaminidase C-terminal domain-containing protein [Planctomycetota bacterium]
MAESKFYFCETCGTRITGEDLEKGRGKDKQVRGYYCVKCAREVQTLSFDAYNEEQALDFVKAALMDKMPASSPLGVKVVETPVLVPRGGRFKGSVQVSMSCATPGAAIHYTDGPKPTTESPRYQGPVEITETTVLRVTAFKEGAASNLREEHYIIG